MNTLAKVDAEWAWSVYQPSEARPWNHLLAAHLFRRAGFGANRDQLDQAMSLEPAQCVDALLRPSVDAAEFERDADTLAETILAGGDPRQLAAAWTYRILHTPDQLLEKTTLFWHGHFATSADKVQDSEMMWAQNNLLRTHALGDFSAMVHGIAQDPAMLVYLDSVTNRKAHPNENFARELMELFCLGEGNYSERDVLELARCFTGWEIKNRKFRKNRYQHDTGDKTVLGQRGDFDGEDGVRIVLEQAAMPRFIVRKLIRFFVFDEPTPPDHLVEPLATEFRNNGMQVGPIVGRILASNLFFSEYAVARKVRSPIELAIGLLRAVDGSTNVVELAKRLTQLGHGLFYPPNVKGWDGGRTWINSSTLLGRANLIRDVLRNDKTRYDRSSLAAWTAANTTTDPLDVVRELEGLLLAVPLTPTVRERLVSVLRDARGNESERVAELIHALSTLPEFQLA